ncbi:hypothetical protein ABZV67_19320 [Streptomyces sp. NPDC005065]|uniref:hypothetical protein n=1 Tax=Streptomyces sp. NPDC005065 TaxID=3154461 RepID=UPI0033A4991D
MPDDLIGPNVAADILHVSRVTIHNMVQRGELTGYMVTSGLTKVSESQVRSQVKVVAPKGVDLHIRRIVDAAPSLTPEQIDTLRALLAA